MGPLQAVAPGPSEAVALKRYTQSLQIEERLGNQAGIAVSYHQLGMLAHDRGDHNTAEQRYTQSLQILERLGDQAGLASTSSQVGILLTQTRRPRDAIALSLRALSIRRNLLGTWSRLDLSWLKRQRRLVGDDAFATAVAAIAGEESAQTLADLLERVSEPEDEGGEGASGA